MAWQYAGVIHRWLEVPSLYVPTGYFDVSRGPPLLSPRRLVSSLWAIRATIDLAIGLRSDVLDAFVINPATMSSLPRAGLRGSFRDRPRPSACRIVPERSDRLHSLTCQDTQSWRRKGRGGSPPPALPSLRCRPCKSAILASLGRCSLLTLLSSLASFDAGDRHDPELTYEKELMAAD